MAETYECVYHGVHGGYVCPHCERLQRAEEARRQDLAREDERESRRREEDADKYAKEARERAWREEDELRDAVQRHRERLEQSEKNRREQEEQAFLSASGELEANADVCSAMTLATAGEYDSALLMLDKAHGRCPTYMSTGIARALILRQLRRPFGAELDRVVRLACAGAGSSAEYSFARVPHSVGTKALIAASLGVCFGTDAEQAARQLRNAGNLSEDAHWFLSGSIPGLAEELLRSSLVFEFTMRRRFALEVSFRQYLIWRDRWRIEWERAKTAAVQGPVLERRTAAAHLAHAQSEWSSVLRDAEYAVHAARASAEQRRAAAATHLGNARVPPWFTGLRGCIPSTPRADLDDSTEQGGKIATAFLGLVWLVTIVQLARTRSFDPLCGGVGYSIVAVVAGFVLPFVWAVVLALVRGGLGMFNLVWYVAFDRDKEIDAAMQRRRAAEVMHQQASEEQSIAERLQRELELLHRV